MTEFEYMILWPAVSSVLAVILTIAGCVWARKMYWRDQEKKRIIPEWFEKYKEMRLDEEVVE